MTSLMENNDDIAKITLRIQSAQLSNQEITRRLKSVPTKIHEKGERMSPNNPLSASYNENLWLMEFEEGKSFDDLFVSAGKFFDENRATLLDLAETCEFDLFCGYFPGKPQGGFCIEKDALQKIARVPVDIIFDVYALKV